MTTKNPYKTLARVLQSELGCTYCQALNAVRATQSRAIEKDNLDASTAFKVCRDAAARKDFDFFGLIKEA